MEREDRHDWSHLDNQLRAYGPLFRDELGILTPDSEHLATAIASELRALPSPELKSLVIDDPILTNTRLEELKAFQSWMEIVHTSPPHPAVTRAQVITQNYVCFVYLGDALFRALRKGTPFGSVTRKCCKFLTDNPVRAFRNAMAHANWRYMSDFQGLEFWARKGNAPDETVTRFEVRQQELDFWQMLARAVAYVAYTDIVERDG